MDETLQVEWRTGKQTFLVRGQSGVLVGCVIVDRLGIACERVRLPHLDREPLALAEGQGRNVLRAVSEEAALFGVTAGQMATGARALCPDLIILPYDRTAYDAAATSVWDALATVSDAVEPVSPEVAFVEFSERHAERDAAMLAATLARAVGVPVQVGVGRSKLVAERAARTSSNDKGGGPVIVSVGEEAVLLASLPVARIADLPRRVVGRIQISRRLLLRLERLGIHTLGDALAFPLDRLPRLLRPVGQLLRDLAYGVDRDSVRPLWPPRSITEEVQFDEGVEDRFIAAAALRPLAERVAYTLTAETTFARTLAVRAGLLDGTLIEQRDRFVLPLSRSADLYRHAARLLNTLPIDQPVTSLGLVAGELGSGGGVQLSLPTLEGARQMPAEVRRLRLEAALDYLRREYGLRVVMTGAHLLRSRRATLYGAAPLGHLLSDPVCVATNRGGQPVRYWHRPRWQRETTRYDVRRVADRWRESRWRQDLVVTDAEVFRVETDPWGMHELRRIGAEWRLTAAMD